MAIKTFQKEKEEWESKAAEIRKEYLKTNFNNYLESQKAAEIEEERTYTTTELSKDLEKLYPSPWYRRGIEKTKIPLRVLLDLAKETYDISRASRTTAAMVKEFLIGPIERAFLDSYAGSFHTLEPIRKLEKKIPALGRLGEKSEQVAEYYAKNPQEEALDAFTGALTFLPGARLGAGIGKRLITGAIEAATKRALARGGGAVAEKILVDEIGRATAKIAPVTLAKAFFTPSEQYFAKKFLGRIGIGKLVDLYTMPAARLVGRGLGLMTVPGGILNYLSTKEKLPERVQKLVETEYQKPIFTTQEALGLLGLPLTPGWFSTYRLVVPKATLASQMPKYRAMAEAAIRTFPREGQKMLNLMKTDKLAGEERLIQLINNTLRRNPNPKYIHFYETLASWYKGPITQAEMRLSGAARTALREIGITKLDFTDVGWANLGPKLKNLKPKIISEIQSSFERARQFLDISPYAHSLHYLKTPEEAWKHWQFHRYFGVIGPITAQEKRWDVLSSKLINVAKTKALDPWDWVNKMPGLNRYKFLDYTPLELLKQYPTFTQESKWAELSAKFWASRIGQFMSPHFSSDIYNKMDKSLWAAIKERFPDKANQIIKSVIATRQEPMLRVPFAKIYFQPRGLIFGAEETFRNSMKALKTDFTNAEMKILNKLMKTTTFRPLTEVGIPRWLIDRARAYIPGFEHFFDIYTMARFHGRVTYHLMQMPEYVLFSLKRNTDFTGPVQRIGMKVFSNYFSKLFASTVGAPIHWVYRQAVRTMGKEVMRDVTKMTPMEERIMQGTVIGEEYLRVQSGYQRHIIMGSTLQEFPQAFLDTLSQTKWAQARLGVYGTIENIPEIKSLLRVIEKDPLVEIFNLLEKYPRAPYGPKGVAWTQSEIKTVAEFQNLIGWTSRVALKEAKERGQMIYLYPALRSALERSIHESGLFFPYSYAIRKVGGQLASLLYGPALRGKLTQMALEKAVPKPELTYEERWRLSRAGIVEPESRARYLEYRILEPLGLEFGGIRPGGPTPAVQLMMRVHEDMVAGKRDALLSYLQTILPALREYIRDFPQVWREIDKYLDKRQREHLKEQILKGEVKRIEE